MTDADRQPPLLKRNYFLILLSLADGPTHGYEIKRDIEERTHGELRIDPGTLYRLIGRLLDEGFIEETDDRPDPALDDPRRRYYRLTVAGRSAVAAEADRMADLATQARELVPASPPADA